MNVGKQRIENKKPHLNDEVVTEVSATDIESVTDADPEDDNNIDEVSLLARLHLEKQMAQENAVISGIMEKYVANNTAPLARERNPRTVELMMFERLTADLDPWLRKRLSAHTQTSIPPSEDDWPTWEVPVPSGREETIVCDLLLIADYGGVHRRSTPPRSAYTAPGITGRIYIEARTRNDVVTLFKPIRGIRWWETKVVTRADAMKLLNRRPAIYAPRANAWIRLKNWPFKNDLAFIQEVLQHDALRVTMLPRPWYHKPPDFKQSRKRPTAKPFDRNKAAHISGPSSVLTVGSGLAAKHHYFDIRYKYFPPRDSYTSYDASGFLELIVNSSEYFPIDVYPQLSEIRPFMACVSITHAQKLLHTRLADNRRLKFGDRVLISSTPSNFNTIYERHVGRTGIVDDITNTFAYIHLLDVDSGLSETIQIPLSSIRRHYKIGDYVKTYVGSARERAGWVTNINETEDRITIYNSQYTDKHFEALASLTEFAETECRMGQNPHRDFIDMSQFELSVYENLPVTVFKGPFKGRSGTVKSISLRLKANVELRGSHTSSVNQLQEIEVRDLAFELDIHKWYRIQVTKATGGDNSTLGVQLESVHTVPATCSMLATVSDIIRSHTPEPENPAIEDGPWSPDYSNHSARGTPEGVVPDTYWLKRLPHIDTFRTLKISIQSFGMYENGKWDDKIGFYKGLYGSQVNFFSQDTGLVTIPFYYVTPVRPTKAPQNAHCLDEGADLGKRFRIHKFGDEECEVVPFHGGRSGSIRRIATSKLAVIG
ncbi:hypothetical protein NP233_g2713 [Leucocoprinus birnbaumii]|uniref:Chromatin elongation factor SPT5 n=1 Tax=Leucocoprinus birnbaumii TaxID=56174 RepID=A0AAD5W070_9AGAR|nr:hypothetical protein NP233_g2713 [Leucocoprinus birnbaumii]